MSDKIKPHHLGRKAILYVRQSSAHQVMHNQESRILQYAMRDRLRDLGWREIEVIDDDLGRSAAGAVTRAGFDRMVAEVCLGKVGAVAAREVSRFARNSRDWQQLIEMCRVVDTLLVDQEAVYAPRQGNDRLLLGLKGSLNEYELDRPVVICFWSRTALCAPLVQRTRSTPQQSPSISLCPFPMLAAPNGGILPHIAGSGQRHCHDTFHLWVCSNVPSCFWVCCNVPSCKPGTLRTVPVQINFADGTKAAIRRSSRALTWGWRKGG